jgi:NAD(P)H-flavin reductase/predicted pyridoxine 5'-phosphate oxidase superfamily flavin-nucleotide-binding protein
MGFGSAYDIAWHEGEVAMHKLMHVPGQENPNSPFLSPGAGYMVSKAPLLALGTLDEEGRPWTTIFGGKDGFARPIAQSTIGLRTLVDREYDPVIQVLLGRADDEPVTMDGEGKMVGGLTIDLETRMRVKLHGRMLAGALGAQNKGDSVAEAQLVIKIDKSLGNCPKYLNSKEIVPATPKPKLISDSPKLPIQAVALLEKADMFFMSSFQRKVDMDTNHRGGPPGFVRMISNDESGAVLVYPEYSGNRLYESLGNLRTTPLAGITVPDFDTGDVLYFTGKTEVLIGAAASSVLPRSNLAVKVTITSSRFLETGLSFRGISGERSPYNPPVRYAATEKMAPGTAISQPSNNYVSLVSSTKLTPTISRFRFRFDDPSRALTWNPGQYAMLDFSDDLDIGWSHMRDGDPRSLNDDYLRTFTISSSPSPITQRGSTNQEFELTIRRVGKATDWLFRQASKTRLREKLRLPLKGFEGEFRFDKRDGAVAFIAGGIGITPVLGQIESMDAKQLRLLWTIGMADIGLVADTLKRFPQLVGVATLFLTGKDKSLGGKEQRILGDIVETGVKIERRRIAREDVDRINDEKGVDEWYMCVGPGLKSSVLNWLAGKRIVYEDFAY